MATLTSANAVFMLGAVGLYNAPIQIQGFAVDDAFASNEVEMAETMMGVDGNLSGGYTPYPVPLEFSLQADSASNEILDAIMQYQDAEKEVLSLNATISIPGISMAYTFSNGFLTKGSPMSSAKKVMQPRRFEITFNKILRVPV